MRDFTVLVLKDAYPTSVAATLGILAAAKTMAMKIGAATPTWKLYSMNGGSIALQSGFSVVTAKLPKRSTSDRSTWIIPGLGLDGPLAVKKRFEQSDAFNAAMAVKAHVDAGGKVAASCTAVFLLQVAGVLVGKRATTAWWMAPELQRLAPGCHVNADRMVCTDGNIMTAGAAFAQTDLMLHLLRIGFGKALSDAVAKVLLIDGRQAQAPFIVPEAFSNGDELVGRLASRVESSLPTVPSIGELAKEFCMSERTLSRHITRATGKSTSSLLQSIRQRKARQLLESSRMTVEQVAIAVGYQDATALRRLLRKTAGANPSQFRPSAALEFETKQK